MQQLIQESRTVNEVGSKDSIWGQNAGVVLDGGVLGPLVQTTRSEFGGILAEAALEASPTGISEAARAPGDGIGAVAYPPAFHCRGTKDQDSGSRGRRVKLPAGIVDDALCGCAEVDERRENARVARAKTERIFELSWGELFLFCW